MMRRGGGWSLLLGPTVGSEAPPRVLRNRHFRVRLREVVEPGQIPGHGLPHHPHQSPVGPPLPARRPAQHPLRVRTQAIRSRRVSSSSSHGSVRGWASTGAWETMTGGVTHPVPVDDVPLELPFPHPVPTEVVELEVK